MTNRDYYKDFIEGLYVGDMAFSIPLNHPVSCFALNCKYCLFKDRVGRCVDVCREWLKEEYTDPEKDLTDKIKSLMAHNLTLFGPEVRSLNLSQTIEECGELIKAISKYNRTLGIGLKTEVTKEKAYADLLNEVADVCICIMQFIHINRCEKEVMERVYEALKKINKRYLRDDKENL